MRAYVVFNTPKDDLFKEALRSRVNEYFKSHRLSIHANNQMRIKIVVGISSWVLTYFLILNFSDSAFSTIGLFLIHGITHVFIGLNLGHDAAHNATFTKRKWNNLLSLSFDVIVGVNSYRWRLAHNFGHHIYSNIHEADPNIAVTRFLRLSPNARLLKCHFYQNVYVLCLYSLVSIMWIAYADLKFFLYKPVIGVHRTVKILLKDYLVFFVGKALYVLYIFVIPCILISNFMWVIIGWFSMQCLNGLILAFVLQMNHILEELQFPVAEQGCIDNDFYRHVLSTTMDYGLNNPIFTWVFGSLNLHVAHHLFPNHCHIHYAKMTPIIVQTAKEYGVVYNGGYTPWGGFKRHLQAIARLGRHNTITE